MFLFISASAAPKTLTRLEQSSVWSPTYPKTATHHLFSTMATTPGNNPPGKGPWHPFPQPLAPKAYRWVGQEGCGPKGWWINWWVPWLLLLYPCPVLLEISWNTVSGRQETHQQIFNFFLGFFFFNTSPNPKPEQHSNKNKLLHRILQALVFWQPEHIKRLLQAN